MEAVIITKELLTQKLKKLPKDCNKGSNGTLNIVAGTPQYRGAADLCVGGALRTGVGIVRLIAEEPVVAAVCARHPSCTFSPVTGSIERRNAIYNSREKCFLIGCGLGLNAQTCTDVSNVLATAKKAVLDADALNAVSANP